MTDQKTLMAVCGHMDQIAGVRQMEFQDGRAAGLRCAMIHNGPLELPLMLDKCLDPAWIRYKGINLSLLTKPGLQGRNPYDTAGDEAVRSIMGGAMFTCGLGNVHGNRVVDGVEYPVHGRMRTTPAEKISMDAFWENGEYKILVSGRHRSLVKTWYSDERLRRLTAAGRSYSRTRSKIRALRTSRSVFSITAMPDTRFWCRGCGS